MNAVCRVSLPAAKSQLWPHIPAARFTNTWLLGRNHDESIIYVLVLLMWWMSRDPFVKRRLEFDYFWQKVPTERNRRLHSVVSPEWSKQKEISSDQTSCNDDSCDDF